MARNDDRDQDFAQPPSSTGGGSRHPYRDNDDAHEPISADQRNDPNPDTKSEARGMARDTDGNVARGTDANPRGPEGNDRQRGRPERDAYDADLDRDNRKSRE